MRALLIPSAPYAAVDPCVGDGTALVEIAKDTGAHLTGVELDADRAAGAAQKELCSRQRLWMPGVGRNVLAAASESALQLRVWTAQQ